MEFGDFDTTYSVRLYPAVGEDNASFRCAAASGPSRPPHLHVRFSHHIFDEIEDEEYEIDSRTICLSNDVVAEESGDNCRGFILSEGLCYWPIDIDTVLDIADEVTEKLRLLRFDLQVDILSVPIAQGYFRSVDEDHEGFQDFRENAAAAAACDGDLAVRSLKRKRIEYERDGDGEDRENGGGDRCVICLEDLTAGTDVAVMPCNHYSFHDDCLSSWLEKSPSCPLCRRKIPAAAAIAGDSYS